MSTIEERLAALESWASEMGPPYPPRAARSAASEKEKGEADANGKSADKGCPSRVETASPASPTPRGSMPTRGEMARVLYEAWDLHANGRAGYPWVAVEPYAYLAEADAALSLIAPYLAALERERDEARRAQRKAEERADVFLDEHRDAVKERDAALARAEKAEAAQRPLTIEDVRSVLREQGDLFYAEKNVEAITRALNARRVPPPSASAGTGTISDHDLAQELALTFKNAMGPGPWSDVGPNSYLERSRNAELAQARRAKELLGGSKAVKLPPLKAFDPDESSAETMYRVAFNDAILAVRAALAGRGETA